MGILNFVGLATLIATLIIPLLTVVASIFATNPQNKKLLKQMRNVSLGIGVISVIILILINSDIRSEYAQIEASQTAIAATSQVSVPSSSPIVNTPTPHPTVLTPSITLAPTQTAITPPVEDCNPAEGAVLYNFEQPNRGWHTDEGSFKPDEVDTTSDLYHCGSQSLMVTTTLNAIGESILVGTNSKVYFDAEPPLAYNGESATQDFTGHILTCFVFIPADFWGGSSGNAKISVYVKSRDGTNQPNQWGNPIEIENSMFGVWTPLSLDVATNGVGADPTFNSSFVMAIGVRIEATNTDNETQQVSFYVDDCMLSA